MRGLWKPVLICVLVVAFILGGFALVLLSGGDAGPRLAVG